MQNPGFSVLPREKLYTVKPYRLCPMMVLTCTPSMTHPRPPCILFCILPVSTLACSKILVLFIQAWWEKLHSQKAPLILVWYSTPISSYSHIAYRTTFRQVADGTLVATKAPYALHSSSLIQRDALNSPSTT